MIGRWIGKTRVRGNSGAPSGLDLWLAGEERRIFPAMCGINKEHIWRLVEVLSNFHEGSNRDRQSVFSHGYIWDSKGTSRVFSVHFISSFCSNSRKQFRVAHTFAPLIQPELLETNRQFSAPAAAVKPLAAPQELGKKKNGMAHGQSLDQLSP